MNTNRLVASSIYYIDPYSTRAIRFLAVRINTLVSWPIDAISVNLSSRALRLLRLRWHNAVKQRLERDLIKLDVRRAICQRVGWSE